MQKNEIFESVMIPRCDIIVAPLAQKTIYIRNTAQKTRLLVLIAFKAQCNVFLIFLIFSLEFASKLSHEKSPGCIAQLSDLQRLCHNRVRVIQCECTLSYTVI